MATIDDFGGIGDSLGQPKLGGEDGWAAAVRDEVRATLAAEIERRAAIKASADAQATVADAVQAARDALPTLYADPA